MIKWEDPPGIKQDKEPEPYWVAELRKRPYQWARIITNVTKPNANNWQNAIQYSRKWYLEGETWEATRRTENGVISVYARYIERVK